MLDEQPLDTLCAVCEQPMVRQTMAGLAGFLKTRTACRNCGAATEWTVKPVAERP
jgi:hypothetical protein